MHVCGGKRKLLCHSMHAHERESTLVCHGVHSCFPWLGYMYTNAHQCMCALMFEILCPGIALMYHGFTNEEQKWGS